MQPKLTAIQPLQRTDGTTAILLAPRVTNFVAGAGQPLPNAVRQRMEAASERASATCACTSDGRR